MSLGCVCNTTATLPSAVAVLTPRKTSSITWILAAPAGYWLKMVHSWNFPSALSSMEPVDMPTKYVVEFGRVLTVIAGGVDIIGIDKTKSS